MNLFIPNTLNRTLARLAFFSLLTLPMSIFKTVQAQLPKLQLVSFSTGYSNPLDIENCGDSRLFVVEKGGKIWICDSTGKKSKNPFLDITSEVFSVGSEQGLLGLAFSPNYKTDGFFYVNYIDKNQNTRIARFKVSATNP